MARLLTLEEGIILTKFARQSIDTYIRNQQQLDIPTTNSESLHENRGVFVTLKKRQGEGVDKWMLRGCIGRLPPGPISRVEPVPLLEATRQAALSSALDDPRFPPVQIEELGLILVEVSVLTVPEELEVQILNKLDFRGRKDSQFFTNMLGDRDLPFCRNTHSLPPLCCNTCISITSCGDCQGIIGSFERGSELRLK